MAKHRDWLGLMIGNSRLHWAYFQDYTLSQTWETPHLEQNQSANDSPETSLAVAQISPLTMGLSFLPSSIEHCPLYLASVVPAQTVFWSSHPHIHLITLGQIPLNHLYPTLGIDRALAALGAGKRYGFPVLVIDGGTALTLTGVDGERNLVGGAILPGLRLQFQSLAQKTAQLPEITLPATLPPRWATDTKNAIASGILYGVLAGLESYITDWQTQFPDSSVIITGGDRSYLLTYLEQKYSNLSKNLFLDADLIFWGMQSLIVDD
ncbi:MAG: pantothenate kinase [Microcystaceae cyanobacterium]